jgi:hypothetical protein
MFRVADERPRTDPEERRSGIQGNTKDLWRNGTARGLVTSRLTNQAAAADLPIAAFTRGMTSSAINCIERLLSAGSAQSIPA